MIVSEIFPKEDCLQRKSSSSSPRVLNSWRQQHGGVRLQVIQLKQFIWRSVNASVIFKNLTYNVKNDTRFVVCLPSVNSYHCLYNKDNRIYTVIFDNPPKK